MSCYTCHSELRPDAAYCPYCGARQPDVPERDDYLYSAFISYRHRLRDEEVAQQVQKAIETYVLPKSVAEFYGAPKLQRVFRDADELPTTGSLPDSITEALAKSRALIVVCSPDTPDSRWVQREIEYFASIHGRHKIHLVLADGTSSESIPPALLKRLEVGDDGVVEERDTEPLAADFRPDAAKRARQEKLRVIAALVGCSFDDLAQREQVRRRKLTGIAAGILAALLIVGAFLVHSALSSQQAADLSEVKRSVDYAHQLYSEGDRYGAITEALRAADRLPLSADEETAVSVKEALEEALFVNGDTSTAWYPAFAVASEPGMGAIIEDKTSQITKNESEAILSSMVIANSADWFALSDIDRTISTYDLATGQKLAVCEMPVSDKVDPSSADYFRHLYDSNGLLLVSDLYSNGGFNWSSLACFDPRSGECKWSYATLQPITGIALSPGGRYFQAVQASSESAFTAILVNTESGEMEGVEDLPDTFAPADLPVGTMGEKLNDYYFGCGGTLYKFSYKDAGLISVSLANTEIRSVDYRSGVVVVTSEEEALDTAYPFTVQAFDEDLNELWSFEGSYESEMRRSGGFVSLVIGSPAVEGYLSSDEGESVVVSFGHWVKVFDLEDGEEIYSKEMENSVVGMLVSDVGGSNADLLYVATAGRKIVPVYPFADNSRARSMEDQFKLETTQNMRWVGFGWIEGGTRLGMVALSADDDKDIFSFNTNFDYYEPEKDDYTLDELKVMAHEVLKADGYE